MTLTERKLGEFIELRDVRNSDLQYGADDVRGVNNLKLLMPTKADLAGRDLSKFQIVYPDEFVFNHRTSRNGSKFSIAYNDTGVPVICTEDYVVFRIKEECKTILDSRWIYMFFNRPEFDRYVITNSWGSSTEFYNWEDICEVDIPMPPIEIQQKYAAIYNAMLANQQSYEQGLEDLKLVCDGYIESLRRQLPLEKIGRYIERIDVRNGSNGTKNVMGVSTTKEFRIPTAKVNRDELAKAMIVCADRGVAFRLLKEILAIRPEWGEKRRSEKEKDLMKEQLDKLLPLPKINLVATQGANDEKDLFDACGTKEYRKMLDKQFKNNNSNFKIAVVVDMWITGFDVPSLAVMYIDKPLQKHTLIQTISRVNRVFDGKDKGLVVDYIGIKNDMLEAVKKYGSPQESPVDELNITLGIFRNHLKMIDDLLLGFNAVKFFTGEPLERLNCLNSAAEYVQARKDTENRFMGLSRRLKSAYNICFPSGELTDEETAKAQFYLAIRSIIYKQTKGDAPDAEVMNRVVEEMVQNAIACTGIENVVDEHKSVDLFSDEFIEQLNTVKLPITKFNALLKLLRKAISAYGRTNKVKAIEFDERLRKVVDDYNSRDKLVFTSEVVSDFVNGLSDQLLQILKDLQEDQSSFEKMGISFEEKAFYDILVKVRDDHGFPYADEKCVILAKKIKELVDDKAQFADWSTRDDIKNQLNMELTVLLYKNGYPPEWDEEVFEKVMEQAENFKRYSDKG